MAPSSRRGKKRKQEELGNMTLCDVVGIALQNKWISARDLCRMEATSKTFKEWIQQNEAWKTLCCSRFPNTSFLTKPFVRMLGGHKMLFRHRTSSLAEEPTNRNLPPLPPPYIKEENVVLLVDVSVGGEPAFSDALSGKDLLGVLLETGSAFFSITDRFVVGKASCWFQKEECKCGKCCFDCLQYDARIDLVTNANDGTSCCIYQPGEKGWSSTMAADPIGDGKYDWVNGQPEWLNCFETFSGQKGLALRMTPEAAEIERRLQGKICFQFSIHLSVIEPGDVIAVTGFQIEAMYHGYKDNDGWEAFDSALAKAKGVSLLHILEQLQGRHRDPPKGSPRYVYEKHSIVALT